MADPRPTKRPSWNDPASPDFDFEKAVNAAKTMGPAEYAKSFLRHAVEGAKNTTVGRTVSSAFDLPQMYRDPETGGYTEQSLRDRSAWAMDAASLLAGGSAGEGGMGAGPRLPEGLGNPTRRVRLPDGGVGESLVAGSEPRSYQTGTATSNQLAEQLAAKVDRKSLPVSKSLDQPTPAPLAPELFRGGKVPTGDPRKFGVYSTGEAPHLPRPAGIPEMPAAPARPVPTIAPGPGKPPPVPEVVPQAEAVVPPEPTPPPAVPEWGSAIDRPRQSREAGGGIPTSAMRRTNMLPPEPPSAWSRAADSVQGAAQDAWRAAKNTRLGVGIADLAGQYPKATKILAGGALLDQAAPALREGQAAVMRARGLPQQADEAHAAAQRPTSLGLVSRVAAEIPRQLGNTVFGDPKAEPIDHKAKARDARVRGKISAEDLRLLESP